MNVHEVKSIETKSILSRLKSKDPSISSRWKSAALPW